MFDDIIGNKKKEIEAVETHNEEVWNTGKNRNDIWSTGKDLKIKSDAYEKHRKGTPPASAAGAVKRPSLVELISDPDALGPGDGN